MKRSKLESDKIALWLYQLHSIMYHYIFIRIRFNQQLFSNFRRWSSQISKKSLLACLIPSLICSLCCPKKSRGSSPAIRNLVMYCKQDCITCVRVQTLVHHIRIILQNIGDILPPGYQQVLLDVHIRQAHYDAPDIMGLCVCAGAGQFNRFYTHFNHL